MDGGLRRRGGGGSAGGGSLADDQQAASVTKIVKKFDMYAKVKEEYTVKKPPSTSSSSRTIIAWVLTAVLTLSELWGYATSTGTKEHMLVDTSLGQKLRINVNITFPALSCAEVHVDAMDVAGDYHPYMEGSMQKQRLSGKTGKPLGRTVAEEANVVENKAFELPPDYCGSCYGAEEKEGDCCNTCDQVVAKYSLKGWATKDIRRDSEQCKRDAANPLAGVGADEGCNLSGFMLVNKVAGNFHVALGESVVRDGRFIHQFQPQDAAKFNASHIVHSLSFGDPYPGMRSNPMDNKVNVASVAHGTGLYQYFIKLVPTLYEKASASSSRSSASDLEDGGNIWTNQYSFTERFRPLAEHMGGPHLEAAMQDHHAHGTSKHQPMATTVLPGVFWVYDLSAFMLQIKPVHTPFSHLLARLCAIAGGVFTLVNLIGSGLEALLQKFSSS